MTKDVGYIHAKIDKAGIKTVVSVSENGLQFADKATPTEITAAQAIFDTYIKADSDKYAIANRMIDLQMRIDACKQVEKDITIPNGIKTDLEAEYAALKAAFNGQATTIKAG